MAPQFTREADLSISALIEQAHREAAAARLAALKADAAELNRLAYENDRLTQAVHAWKTVALIAMASAAILAFATGWVLNR